MKLMGSSLAFAGLAGCRWETSKIAPFAARPDERIPGKPEYFATSISIAGEPAHLLVTSYDGRPLKVEGNPDHPSCLGSSDQYAQASILSLYDPDRSDYPRQRDGGQAFSREWNDFERFAREFRRLGQGRGGEGFSVLLEPSTSVTLESMLVRLQVQYPHVQFYQHEATRGGREQRSLQRIYGKSLVSRYDVSSAQVIACFDVDLLQKYPGHLRHTREFAAKRDPAGEMNRLYVAESQFSVTGAMADHRLPRRSSQVALMLVRLEEILKRSKADAQLDDETEVFLAALAEDLDGSRGSSIVAVGDGQPTEVHVVAHRINQHLGNVGKTITLRETTDSIVAGSIETLVEKIESDEVDTLLILGGNPVYDAPGHLRFEDALKEVKCSIHLSQYVNETSSVTTWHLPEAHPFECWGDLQSLDGDHCIGQPLIDPLLNGRSSTEVLALFVGDERTSLQRVREAVSDKLAGAMSEQGWRKIVHDGFSVPSDASVKVFEATMSDADYRACVDGVRSLGSDSLELVFTESDTVFDGRYANNGWLQETPDSLTKLTWDNAALVGPRTAEDLELDHGDWIVIERNGSQVELPVFVLPGQARGSIGIAYGYGRTAAGNVGGLIEQDVAPVGASVFPLTMQIAESFVDDFTIQKVRPGETYEFATTQDHHAIDTVGLEERGQRVGQLVREAEVSDYRDDSHCFEDAHHHHPESLWEEPSYDDHAWGMAIDLNKCIGCNACVVACQAENNVPIVGRDQVRKGREMHWIRVDRYFNGDPDDPTVATQPVACHHCENAPCEQVCPVAATVHSDEGLNDMVYNRCIGTRYCANNCPYKVRRFNFFDYNEALEEPNRQLAQLVMNPEVTVRSRGVMEKCTYCVQRIQSAKITAGNEARPIQDGEIKTACQQACSSNAIEFGDLNSRSKVSKLHSDSRSYAMLSELNVKPRTKYLGRLRNPHPKLVDYDLTLQHGS